MYKYSNTYYGQNYLFKHNHNAMNNSIQFSISNGHDTSASVLNQWPDHPYKHDLCTDKMLFKLKPSATFPSSKLPVVQIRSNSCKELEIFNIPQWLYGYFKMALKNYKYVQIVLLKERESDNTESSKLPLTLLCAKTKLGPTFAICCDASENFYCSYTINRLLNEILMGLSDRPNESFLQLIRKNLPERETFEEQYIDSVYFRNSVGRGRDAVLPTVFQYSSDRDLERIEKQNRSEQYEMSMEREASITQDPIKKALLTNKSSIKQLSSFSEAIANLAKLDEKYSDVLNEATKECLRNQTQELLKRAEEHKCKICYTNWINCMLPECRHFLFCQKCIEKSVCDYCIYKCPCCNQFNYFVIVDTDIPNKN